MSEAKGIVHVHIEKTAGTSMKSMYCDEYGADNVWGYSAAEDRFRSLGKKFFSIDSEWQQSLRARIFRDAPRFARFGQKLLNALPSHVALPLAAMDGRADVVIGHFTFDQVSGVLPPDNYQYRTLLRDPLQRMISHYEFVQRRSVPTAKLRVVPEDALTTSFEEFALSEPLRNFQTQAVGTRPEVYELIGVVDFLEPFLEASGLRTPASSNHVPRLNVSPCQAPRKFDQGFLREFEQWHSADYALYQSTYDQWSS